MTAQPDINQAVQTQVYRWAYRVLRNHHDALDATQDVLIKWLKSGGNGVENRHAWLRRTTINHCIDLIRRERTPDQTPLEPSSRSTPATEAGQEELRDLVVDGLSRLTDMQRATVAAKVFDRETFAAIAASMGLSISSVKTHYVRGLSALRDSLGAYM